MVSALMGDLLEVVLAGIGEDDQIPSVLFFWFYTVALGTIFGLNSADKPQIGFDAKYKLMVLFLTPNCLYKNLYIQKINTPRLIDKSAKEKRLQCLKP